MKTPSANTNQNTQNKSSKPKVSAEERLEINLERAKKSIAKDLEGEEITQSQANALTKKLDEINAYLSENISEEDADALKEKRKEWSAWAKENNLSGRYFAPLY